MTHARRVPVLMYHHVSPSPGMITTSPANFERQLQWLKAKGFHTLTTDQFAGFLGGDAVPARSLLITFDDGYLDNWVYAFPLLKKYGFRATVFLVTSWVGEGDVRPCMGQAGLPETPEHKECGRRIAAGRADDAILRWSEVRCMREEGVFEFHSHTHTHTRWDIKDPDGRIERMRQELALSRQSLCENLGYVSEHFCWPQGYTEPAYIDLAREAGFRYLYTTDAFGQNRAGADPAHIYRFAVRNRGGGTLGQRILYASNPVVGPVFNRWKRWKRSLRKGK
ncbi:hypothetical protein ERD78_15030 [Allopusillimonas soli]|uniref:Polysaccharide deacetylase family protein n=1 Tax=Allopusillimonas soli TaxID=659016 RepID=A0A853FI72_9BURK|nr:polysaccharide deacetylase family protein [Allopusillimonas soli]NYT38470.1 polysaccharide deacetylase family protein [Allopusillimonas soli]TEA71976.1 hypothetical protein ERD78_15030 [Allopusillimonas soli]